MLDEICGLSDGWTDALQGELAGGYLRELDSFIAQQRAVGPVCLAGRRGTRCAARHAA